MIQPIGPSTPPTLAPKRTAVPTPQPAPMPPKSPIDQLKKPTPKGQAMTTVSLPEKVTNSTISQGIAKVSDTWTESEATLKTLHWLSASKKVAAGQLILQGLNAASSHKTLTAVEKVQRIIPAVNVATATIDHMTTKMIYSNPHSSQASKNWAVTTEGLSWAVVGGNGASLVPKLSGAKGKILLLTLGLDLAGIGSGLVRDHYYTRDVRQADKPKELGLKAGKSNL